MEIRGLESKKAAWHCHKEIISHNITELQHTLYWYVQGVKDLLCALLSHSGTIVLACNNKSEVIRKVTMGSFGD